MSPRITRMTALTAAGVGVDALARAVARQEPLSRPVPWATEGLRSPFAALLPERFDVDTLLDELLRGVLPAERPCGLLVATTSGAISGGFEAWHRGGGATGPTVPPPLAGWPSDLREGEALWRQAPTWRAAQRHLLAPATTVSVACASGAAAFAVAAGWLRDGVVPRVVVVGIDVLSPYIHAGFAGLGALSPTRPRPFAADRDGLLLGEGGAAFLLEGPSLRPTLTRLVGVGLAQDAVHLTAPDRTGAGLLRAARAACPDPAGIDCVSGHLTGTPFNDAMEARALDALFGRPVPLHAAKPVIGHTLGAAGAIETAALVALLGGAEPPPPLDPGDCPVRVAPIRAPRSGLKVSAAFGGIDVALRFGPDDEPVAPSRRVRVSEHVIVEADRFPLDRLGAPATLGRADTYVRAGIAALRELPIGDRTALVLTSLTNCRAADLRYHADLVERGPASVSRVHFAYTIPGAPLAEASILVGAHGPALVFCDGPERGREEAERLVRHGHADDAVALHVEAPAGYARAEAWHYVATR